MTIKQFGWEPTLGIFTTRLLDETTGEWSADPLVVNADKHYLHVQDLAAATWTVTHNLGKRPSVTVVDSAGTMVHGDVGYVSDAELVITFSAPFGGRAYCN